MHQSKLCFVLLVRLCLLVGAAHAQPVQLKLGVIWPRGRNAANAANVRGAEAAIAEINARDDILPDTVVNLEIQDSWKPGAESYAASAGQTLDAVYNLTKSGVLGIIGDFDSSATALSALVTGRYGIPQCSPMSAADQLSDKTQYPTLFRMQAPNSAIGTKLVRLMSHYGWTKFVHLYSASAFGQAFVNPVKAVAEELNMELLLQERFYELSENSNYTTPLLNVAATKAKVILVTAQIFESTLLYAEAYRQNLTGPDYVWVTTNALNDYPDTGAPNANNTLSATMGPEALVKVAYFWIQESQKNQTTDVYMRFNQKIKDLYPGTKAQTGSNGLYQANMYDCTYALLWGVHNYLKEKKYSPSILVNPDFLQNSQLRGLSNISIYSTGQMGISGPYLFDAYGNYAQGRHTIKSTLNMSDTDVFYIDEQGHIIPHATKVAKFYGNTTDVPLDFPPSKLINPMANDAIVILPVLSAVLGLTCLASIGFIIAKRDNPIIKRSSVKSNVMILTGLTLGSISPWLYLGMPTAGMCGAQTFVATVSFGMVFSNLLAKTWRVYKIFHNPSMRMMKISDEKLLAFSSGVILIELIICIVWMAVDQPKPAFIAHTDVTHFMVCESTNDKVQLALTAVSLVFNGILLSLTTVLSYLVRNIPFVEYNESRWIAISVYNIVAVAALFLPLIYSKDFIKFAYILRTIMTLLAIGVTLVALYLPKFVSVMFDKDFSSPPTSFEKNPNAILSMSSGSNSNGSNSTKGKPSRNAVAEDVSLKLSDVPVFMTSKRLLSFFARWRKADLVVSHGYLMAVVQQDNNPNQPQVSTYRLSGASVNTNTDTEKGVVYVVLSTMDGRIEFSLHADYGKRVEEILQRYVNPSADNGNKGSAPLATKKVSTM